MNNIPIIGGYDVDYDNLLRTGNATEFEEIDEIRKHIEEQIKTEENIEIQIFFKKVHELAIIPKFAKSYDSGFDLISVEDYILIPGVIMGVRTGICVGLPDPNMTYPFTFEMQIRPRSGLGLKHGVTIPNSPATIDNGYTGELIIPMTVIKNENYQIKAGDRVAQGVISPVLSSNVVKISEVAELDNTERGDGGFGSTGK